MTKMTLSAAQQTTSGDGTLTLFNRNTTLGFIGFILIISSANFYLNNRSISADDMDHAGHLRSERIESPQNFSIKGSTNSKMSHETNHQWKDCAQEDPMRWSNRPHPMSHVNSLFNCDKDGALCTYYYPANFFDKECGLGKDFSHHIDDAEAMKLNGTLWNYMPSIGFPTLTMNNTCLEVKSNQMSNQVHFLAKNAAVGGSSILHDIGHREEDGFRCFTERLSFLHVHKAGGSSLHNAFNFISSSKNSALERHKFFTPSRGPMNIKRSTNTSNRMISVTLDSLSHAIRYPEQKFAEKEHVIFAVVRDPTERFISSIGQALGASGSGGNHIAPILKRECIKETSADTLKCLARYVRDHGFWIELHFTPQVIDISFTTMWQDVPIAVFPFKHLGTILSHFGRNDVKVRDGSQQNYRSDPILTEMNVNDYDDESLQIVCEIYEMDVRMQRSLGFQVPRCDRFIPF